MIDSAALKELLGGIAQYDYVQKKKTATEVYLEMIISLTDA